MFQHILEQFLPISAEIVIAFSTIMYLIIHLFFVSSAKIFSWLSVLTLLISAMIAYYFPYGKVFNGSLLIDDFSQFFKIIIYIITAFILALSIIWFSKLQELRFEYIALTMFSVLGMSIMIAAQDLITLYMGLELQSLCFYVLATFLIKDKKSSEAGIKYFILGSLASGIFLYGVSFIYGTMGTFKYSEILLLLNFKTVEISSLFILGVVLCLIAFAFKISAAPFHIWSPDVYEGAPLPSVTLFATVSKAVGLIVITRMLVAFEVFLMQWIHVLMFLSAASLLVGSFGGVIQKNIQRLLAYSSIAHVGYILIALSSTAYAKNNGMLIVSSNALSAAFTYVVIYMITTTGIFAILLSLRSKQGNFCTIQDLFGLYKLSPWLAFWMGVFMFSAAGIPPLAGFFVKMDVFFVAVSAKIYWLLGIAIVSSTVSAYYYLKIVKTIYFEEPRIKNIDELSFVQNFIIWICGFITLLLVVMPNLFSDYILGLVENLFYI